jgi:hypothetical protein
MANARANDPETSKQAAASVTNTKLVQRSILGIYSKQLGLCDSELIDIYYAWVDAGLAVNASPSGIRSRRAELVAMKYLADSGQREKLPSGRSSVIWYLTREGLDAARG